MQVSGGDAVSTALVNSGFWQGDVAALVAHYATVPSGCGQLRPGHHVGAVERVQQHRVEQRRHLRHLGPQALLHRGQVGGARVLLDGHRRLDPRTVRRLVAAVDRRRWTRLDGRGRHPPLHRLQRLLRGGRHAGPGQTAPGAPRRQAPVVHRGRLVERRRLRLPRPGRRHGPLAGLAEGARRAGRELLLRRGRLGQRRRQLLAHPDLQRRRLREALGPRHHDHVRRCWPAAPTCRCRSTGIPQAYRADFGTTSGGTTKLAAVWTDGIAEHGHGHPDVARAGRPIRSPSPPSTARPPPPRPRRVRRTACPLSDQVGFLTYPAGDTLSVGPTEPYGTDWPSAAAGATATASSGTACRPSPV